LKAISRTAERKSLLIFWPDSTEKQAQSNFRKLIHDLRIGLPQAVRYMNISSEYLQWKDEYPSYSDVREFERLSQGQTLNEWRKAESLYRGELMPGLYMEWVVEKRERLAQSYMRVLEKLVNAFEAHRDYSTAVHFARKLIANDQYNEEYYRMLMRLHASNKDTAGALSLFEQLRSVLDDAFGIAPSNETLQIYDRLARNRSDHMTVTAGVNKHSPLIGRIDEWGDMLRVWKQATTGRPCLLILKGESGIGKTRLAQEFKSWAENQGISSAMAGCYPSVRSLSYTPVTSWLRSIPITRMNSIWMSELVRLMPELVEQYPDLALPAPIQDSWQLTKWYEAIERSLLVKQPLLLILDDIQWCDQESIQFISYLLRSDSKAQLVVIATMRTDESTNDAVERMFSDLHIERKLTELELIPFNSEDTKRLVASSVGEELADRHSSDLYAKSGGNPLFIIETMKEWQAGNDHQKFRYSSFVKNAIEHRLRKLSDCRQLISVVAAVRRPVSTELLGLVLDINEGIVLESLEKLVHLKVMQTAGDGKYDFTHDIIRGIAYDLMSDASRRYCHRQIARALIAYHNEQPEIVAAEVAFHFELAGKEQEALPYYELSALAAEKIYAHETMIKYYRKLTNLLPTEQILTYLLKIGEALIMVGDWNEAERTYRLWLEQSSHSVTILERSFCEVALGDCLRLQGKYEEAKIFLDRAARYFEWMEDNAGRSLVYGSLGVLHYCWGNYNQSLHYLRAKIELPNAVNQARENCRSLGFIGFLFYDQCKYDQAIDWFKKQIKLASEIRDSHAISLAMGGLTLCYLDMDELDQAFDYIVEKLDICKSVGDRMEFATAIGMLGKYYLYQGQRTYATQCLVYCLEEAVMIKDWRIAAIVIELEGRNLMEQRRYEEADLLFDRSLRLFRKLNLLYFICETLYDISLLRHRQNRLERAMEAAEEALGVADRLLRRDMQFMLKVQIVHLNTDTSRLCPSEAVNQLQKMLEHDPNQQERAALHFAIWRLNPKPLEHRTVSLSLYEELYLKSGKQQYLDRCRELNGDLPPVKARVLPKLAKEVIGSRTISQKIISEIDQYLNI